jgi:hypothetical protein
VELLKVDGLVGDDEANGILIVEFDVFEVEGESGEIAVNSPARGRAERTAEIEITGDDGVSGKLGAEIGVPEGAEIKLIHAEREIGGIVVT